MEKSKPMKLNEYQFDCIRTEAPITDAVTDRFTDSKIRLLHGAIGLSTEANELLTMLKAHLFYGKKFNRLNLEEELGDSLWFIALMCNVFDIDMNDLLRSNIAKLRARYPQKFIEELALERNLEEEKQALFNFEKE